MTPSMEGYPSRMDTAGKRQISCRNGEGLPMTSLVGCVFLPAAHSAHDWVDGSDSGSDAEATRARKIKKTKGVIALAKGDDGYPLLPEDIPAGLGEMKDLVRAFVTECYRVYNVTLSWRPRLIIPRKALPATATRWQYPGLHSRRTPGATSRSSIYPRPSQLCKIPPK